MKTFPYASCVASIVLKGCDWIWSSHQPTVEGSLPFLGRLHYHGEDVCPLSSFLPTVAAAENSIFVASQWLEQSQ
jgi:hypothetical protein